MVFTNGDKTVGANISMDEITEFYYTEDASTDPPHFQRFRFYTEDGAYYFYHEKREGDHWPLTEEDATVTGTLELTEEEWTTFFGLLEGGTVTKREEHLESGGSGPWLYLYWTGDKGKIQEFSFRDAETRLAFEDYCNELKARP